jgi:hypothetical protein
LKAVTVGSQFGSQILTGSVDVRMAENCVDRGVYGVMRFEKRLSAAE